MRATSQLLHYMIVFRKYFFGSVPSGFWNVLMLTLFWMCSPLHDLAKSVAMKKISLDGARTVLLVAPL